MDKLDGMSMNVEKVEMDKLKEVFPQCFAEGKLDIDKLLSLCGEYIDNDFEKYKFEWKGKLESLKLAQKRSPVPCVLAEKRVLILMILKTFILKATTLRY